MPYFLHCLCQKKFESLSVVDKVSIFVSLHPGLTNHTESEVAHTPVAVPTTAFQLGHGSSKFPKADKISTMKREGKTGRVTSRVIFIQTSGIPAAFCLVSGSSTIIFLAVQTCTCAIAGSILRLTAVQDQGVGCSEYTGRIHGAAGSASG